MSTQDRADPIVRSATVADIPFLARMDYEASLPPTGENHLDQLLAGTNTPTLGFIERILEQRASNWGNVDDALILERGNEPAASCMVFKPGPGFSDGPLDMNRLEPVVADFEWPSDTLDRVRRAYAAEWAIGRTVLRPQSDLIVETVAVAPEFRGLGLGRRLIQAAFTRARALGAGTLGIGVIHGNKAAGRLYEQYFKPLVSYHAAYFENRFPGFTAYRANLNP